APPLYFPSSPTRRSSDLALAGHSFLPRDPINLLFDRFLGIAAPLQDAFTVLDHLRVAAKISDRVGSVEFPHVRVLTDEIIHASDFTRPLFVVPRTADRRHILQPGRLLSESSY